MVYKDYILQAKHLLRNFNTAVLEFRVFLRKKLPGHACCEEHDVAYNQGGSTGWKFEVDKKLAKCIFEKNGSWFIGAVKSGFAWLMVTINPYPYVVWKRPEVKE